MLTKLIEGERVHIRNHVFNSMATILYIAPGEIYPVQVELDNADSDGHKIYRFDSQDIHREPLETSFTQEVTFAGPNDSQRYIGEVVQNHKNYAYKKEQQFILGVVKFPGVYQGGLATSFYLYSFYLYEAESKAFRGCMPASMFKVLGPYVDGQHVLKEPESGPNEQEADEVTVEKVIIPEKVSYQQMSLLDFL